MKFNCSKTDLSNAVFNVQRGVAVKASIPSLEGILIRTRNSEINLTGYDLEMGITTNIEASIAEPGEIVVSAKLFGDIIRKLPEEIVTIETDNRNVTYITCGNASFQIVGISSEDYPDLPRIEETDKFYITSSILKDMIRKTIYAVSENKSKPIYTGSLFELKNGYLSVVAIDGFRMGVRKEKIDSDSDNQFVIPKKTQNEILKLPAADEESVEIIIAQRHALFKAGGYYVITRLLEGEFLDYNATVPLKYKTELVINTNIITSSVDRISLLSNEKLPSPIVCSFGDDRITFSCKTTMGRANDSISTVISGEDVQIGFNNKYLLDALRNCDCDEIRLELSGPVSPMIIRPSKSDDFLHLIVPMRIS